jgi:hypothetical protein
VLRVGDCAVFASCAGEWNKNSTYIGKITKFWETAGREEMTVRVSWFYRPDETKGLKKPVPKVRSHEFSFI